MKRRGILAAAGAVVAGIVAKGTSQPVRATTTDTNFVATGGSGIAFSASAGYTEGVSASGSKLGVLGQSSGAFNAGVKGSGSGTNCIGVWGAGAAFQSFGVYGQSDFGTGVSGSGPGAYGVAGLGNIYGVVGQGLNTTDTTPGVGVAGMLASTGVLGMVNNAPNSIAVYGYNTSTGANPTGVSGNCVNGIGVYGNSNTNTGIYGVTNAANQYGILGTTTAGNSTAIGGIANTNGSSAFSGGTTNPTAFAGVFQGNVVISGRLVVSDPSYKSGALAHPDGSHRLVYCVESPESWIEDVGTGTLVSGNATVTFDPDFAAVTQTDTYHVFLTEYDGHNNLCVTNRTASGFAVRAANAGASGTFSWKVMVKGKSAVKSERLGTFTMPKISLPDPAKFNAPPPPAAPASAPKPFPAVGPTPPA